jgi:hypothetical protein
MNIKKIDFNDVEGRSELGDPRTKELINIDDNTMVVVIKSDAKIFNGSKLEALRNLFLVDKEGNVIWRVSSKDGEIDMFDEGALFMWHFVGVNYKDGRLTAYRWGFYVI